MHEQALPLSTCYGTVMRLSLPYGQSEMDLEISTDQVTLLESERRAADPIRFALATPICAPRLRDLVKPGQSIVIITSDITRSCPTDLLLPAVMEELEASQVQHEDVSIVFGLGSHRKQTPDEQARLLGAWYGQVRCMDSDPEEVVYVGSTTRGTPIEAYAPVVQADVRIALGNVEYHYFAGYSGGAKALVPGVCSGRTIQHNHAMMVDDQARVGILNGNPVREDLEEGAAMIGLDFILNVIMEGDQIVLAAAGHPIHAHRWACHALDYLGSTPLDAPADIVVVSAGGFPKDINLYQAQKALDNAALAVRPGGVITLVAECRDGMGNATFERWMRGTDAPRILQRIQEGFVLGGHKAAAIAAVQQRAHICLVSTLPDDLVRACGMTPFANATAAVVAVLEQLGSDATIVVIPQGGAVVPRVSGGSHPPKTQIGAV